MPRTTSPIISRRTLFSLIATVGLALAPHLAAASGFNYTMPINSFDMSGIKSWFDHTSPQYGSDASTTMTLYNGSAFTTNVDLSNCMPSTHCYNGHNGIDYGTYGVTGMRILAAASGVVKKAGWDNPSATTTGFGIYIRLWHSQYQQSTMYAHLSSTSVGVVLPDKVSRGQVIALSGKTGGVTGPHLHFSVFDNDSATTSHSIDPYGWTGSGSDPWSIDQGYLWANDSATLYNLVSGDITSATTWGGIYVVDGTAIVDSNVRLTIVPDTIIKFKTKQSKLLVDGILDAEGTASAGIYFTSYHDDSVGGDTDATSIPATDTPNLGDWDRIKLDPGASSTITHAFIRYGTSTGQGTPIMLWNNGGNLTLNNTEVATGTKSSNAYGVYNPSGTTTITSCNIHDYIYGVEMEGGSVSIASTGLHNNGSGIYQAAGMLSVTSSDIYANTTDGIFLSNTSVTISSNSIRGNTTFGLDYGVSPTTTATLNYWGASSGPFNAKYNPTGLGNPVADFVKFIPFLTHWP